MNSLSRDKPDCEDESSQPAGCGLIHPEINLRTIGMVAFRGYSMKPTLVEGDLVEVLPYNDGEVRVGDIIYYKFPDTDEAILHRVVRIIGAGVIARGDNNPADDINPIPPECIIGRVVAVWRRSRRRKLVGGCVGTCYYKIYKIIVTSARTTIPMLRPFYQALVRWVAAARWLPQRFRPKVVAFQDGKETRLRLVWHKRIIGEYDPQRRGWIIFHPFRAIPFKKAAGSEERMDGKK